MKGQRTADYEYDLPQHLIAQQPTAERTASRLLVVRRAEGRIEHRRFAEFVDLIAPRDLLVLNTSRVIRARLLGTRASGARAEILLLKPLGDAGCWEALVSPGGKVRPGRRIAIAPDLEVEILAITDRRTRIVRLHSTLRVDEALERHGHVPLPPYITRPDTASDADRYQTVYAREPGSVAAPTAGLHFSAAMLEDLTRRGVARADVVLHVGAGTFKPVETGDPAAHTMHEEWFSIPEATADAVARTHGLEGRVWAVGTTSARALESAALGDHAVRAGPGETRLFIWPPFRFRVVDALLTNFHLPRSTLLMLVAAFAGYDLVMQAYREAVEREYRFYSYGDAMVVLP